MEDPIATEVQAWEDYDKLRTLIRRDIRSVVEKGEILKRLRDTNSFQKLGDGGYETWSSFLQDGELGITRSYAQQHIQMYEFYILEMALPIEEIEKLKTIKLLRDCMVYINGRNLSQEEALEVIEKAKALSYRDFFKEMTGKDLPESPEVIEGQTQQPPTPITATAEQQAEQEEYLKPKLTRCDMCNHSKIEYFEDQICNCSGKPYVINKSQEAREQAGDYQHEI